MEIYGREIYGAKSFDYEIIKNAGACKRPRGNQQGKKRFYADLTCAFDIEETRLPEVDQSFMYVWQVAITTKKIVMGRTWKEFFEFIRNCSKSLPEDLTLCFFVHNLSHEFQFLSGLYNFVSDEVFALKNRQVLRCHMYRNIELRCSYQLTNMSLDELTHKYNVPHAKKDGEKYDYDKLRFADTPLSESELEYCINDVLGLVEAIDVINSLYGDNIHTMPLTSTGYVRRDVKRALQPCRGDIHKMSLDYNFYRLLRWANRGGDAILNRWYAGAMVEGPIYCYDRESSYPDVLCNNRYPMKQFQRWLHVDQNRLEELIYKRDKAVLVYLTFKNIRLKDKWWPAPYLARAKCTSAGARYSAGRVLSADTLETVLTDLDYKIVNKEYDFDGIEIKEVYCAYKGYLPYQFTDKVKEYFTTKTELKGLPEYARQYTKHKQLLNAISGMCSTDPLKLPVHFLHGRYEEEQNPNIEAMIEHYNQNMYVPYVWGIWCTAWGRYRLREAIWALGDDFIYSDTDSIKFLGEQHIPEIEALNALREADSLKNGAVAVDKHGELHVMGVFAKEPTLSRFKSLGAKKYIYTRPGDTEITSVIAGCGKAAGAELLEMAGGDIDKAFNDYFADYPENPVILYKAGGLEAVYNDIAPTMFHVKRGTFEKDVLITRNVCLRPSHYTIGLTEEYRKIINQMAYGNVKKYNLKGDRYDEYINLEENKKNGNTETIPV